MTTEQLSLASIDDAEAVEDARHAKAKQRFADARKAFKDLQELLAEPLSVAGAKLVKTREESKFDPHEYGGKKKLLLRLIASEKYGLSSDRVVSEAGNAGYPGATGELIVPQLSAIKGVDHYLDLENGKWIITDKGLKYLGWK